MGDVETQVVNQTKDANNLSVEASDEQNCSTLEEPSSATNTDCVQLQLGSVNGLQESVCDVVDGFTKECVVQEEDSEVHAKKQDQNMAEANSNCVPASPVSVNATVENVDENLTSRGLVDAGILKTVSEGPSDVFSIESQNTKKILPNGLSETLLNHPAYKTVINELAHLKAEMVGLNSKINRLETENQRLEETSSSDIYALQLEGLEKTIVQQQQALESARRGADAAARAHAQERQQLEAQLNKLGKQVEAERRDKEAMAVRYAVSEKEVLDLRKERETWERRTKEAGRERELMIGKLKTAAAEKARIGNILDAKVHELSSLQKERDKLSDDLSSSDIKIKWLQNKLHAEMEAHKEGQASLTKANQKITELKEECEQVRRDCQVAIRDFQQSQDNKAYTLDQQLKEQQARLIMERHEREDKEETQRQLQQEVVNLRSKHQLLINENNTLSLKVQSLGRERLEYEENLSRLKATSDGQRQELADLQARLAEMESLRIQLQCEQEKVSGSQGEVERLRLSNAELQQDMADCREREADLLHFTQQLTDKNVRLQSEFSATEARAQQLEGELAAARQESAEMRARMETLAAQLDQERAQRREETQLLARHVAEKTQRADALARQLEDQQGENAVLRRKQAAALKELGRELQQCRKRLEQSEAAGSLLGEGSRASSCSSLNAADPVASSREPAPAAQGELPDRQVLMDHIVKLQRANARRCEKLDFLEEHARQLVTELQRKTCIIQSYVLREQAGALSSDRMDRNKAELAKHGGIMASVYSSKPTDSSMTLELSLEINKKLQAVLEDTLLKNITLKESIETLGCEIARLTAGKVGAETT
ncbi:coiled-coil domain-containing protein 186 [Bacillus rossius redtenbacheri]|uniref:coiled-coil domain-containing protein 186 n=1 Tax=Bacillus rossius redtenbacheri TaxID=93214 RepID=UPI002FDD1861